jgi:hypothetical protein
MNHEEPPPPETPTPGRPPASEPPYPKLQAPEREQAPGWEETDVVPEPLLAHEIEEEALAPPPRPGILTLGTAILVFLIALVLFVVTLAPTVGSGDAARIQTTAQALEIGSQAESRPLTVAAGHLLARSPLRGTTRLPLPLGDVAYRVNLSNAIVAALAVLVAFLMCLSLLDATRLGGSPRGRLLFAAAGAASLALAHAFWGHAVVADPIPVNVLLVALITWLFIARMAGRGAWTIVVGTVLLGLAITNQRAIALVAPIYLITGIGLLTHEETRSAARATLMVAIAFIIGLLPLAYLTMVDLSGAPVTITGLAAFSRRLLGGPLASTQPLPPPVSALTSFALNLSISFLLAIVLAVVGLIVLLARPGTRQIGLLLLVLGMGAKAAALLTGSTCVVVWVVVAVWVAIGAAAICRRATIVSTAGLAVVLVALPVAVYTLLPRLAERADVGPWIRSAVSLPAAGPDTPLHPWRLGDRTARADGLAFLEAMPEDAILIAGRNVKEAQTLRYLVQVDGQRPDLVLGLIDDPAELDPLLDRHLGKRTVALTGLAPDAIAEIRRRVWLEPHGVMWIAAPRPASLEEADRKFADGEWWEAAYLYGEAVSGEMLASDDPESLARWAVALGHARFPDLATRVTERYLAVAADPVRAHARLGDLEAAAGATAQAEAHFADALAAQPSPAEREYLNGRIAESRGDDEAARAAYQRCLDLESGHTGARDRLDHLDLADSEPDPEPDSK